MVKKVLGICASLLMVVSLALNFFLLKNQNNANLVDIDRVVDGDSLLLKTGGRVRLGNLEAPELDNCGGQQASKKLQELVKGKKIRLDIFSYDNYNRPIALVYAGNTLVNEIILKEGWARYDGSPSPERERLKKAHDYAFQNKLGIHGSLCKAEEPDDPKCLIKGNIDRHDNDTKTYYFPGCANYKITIVEKDLGESWFCTEKEAQAAGYVKSQNCYDKKY